MSATSKIDREQRLAAAFAHYAQRWAVERGASMGVGEVVRQCAHLVSQATSEGQVCLHLRDVAQSLDAADGQPDGAPITTGALRLILLESQIVGSPEAPDTLPFILDREDRLYLHRYFDYERRLARCLVERRGLRTAGQALPPPVVTLLNTLFETKSPGGAADWQKIAVLTALFGNLTIVSGGPGTGKTTAIVNLLACLLEENPACRVALAAPTGKAAARITETIRERAAHLPARLLRKLPQESFTVHRLLGVLPTGGFRHDARNPLPIDVLILDEASMLDLAMATQLFEAVPTAARIVLVGDKDQLAAVESGAVFAELSADPSLSDERVLLLAGVCGTKASAIVEASAIQNPRSDASVGLRDSVVWLKKNYRFADDSDIGRLAAEINAGDAGGALARLRAASGTSLTWLDEGGATLSKATDDAILAGYVHYVDACRAATPDPRDVARAFGRFRTLCAVREGYRGTHAINRMVSTYLRPDLESTTDTSGRSEWYPGRPVIVLRNDYVLQLFNGDIGIALPDASGALMVYFPDQQSGPDQRPDQGPPFRAIAPVRLPEHETAFAMTVHKAQGSEFDEVAILLPAEPNRVLTRELLYTGVTRARTQVTVIGSAAVIESTIATATNRLSGLLVRLIEEETRL